jgi:O-antigen/teichoic acid export membrane protein
MTGVLPRELPILFYPKSMLKPNFSFSKKFLSGEAHFGFWAVISKLIGLITTFFLISALSVYQYGVFQLLLSIFSILSSVVAIGAGVVSNDINRFIGLGKEAEAKKLFFQYNGVRLAVGLILSAGLFFGPAFLGDTYKPDFILLLKLVSIIVFLETIYTLPKSLLGMRLMFNYSASRSSMYKFFQAGFLAYFFFFSSLTVKEALLSLIVGSVSSLIFLISPTLKAYRPWQGVIMAKENILVKIFRAHGKWDVVNQFVSKFVSNAQIWLIKIFISTEAVAIYSVAQTMIGTIVGFFPTKTLGTLIPQAIGDKAKLQRIFEYGNKYLVILSIIMGVGAAITGPIAIHLIFPKYIPSLPYFLVLLFGLPITAIGSVITVFIIAMRRQKYLVYQKVLKAITALPMILLMIFFGLWGLVAYQLVFSFLLCLSIYRFVRPIPPGFRLEWHNFFRFGAEDKVFIKRFWVQVLSFIKSKMPLT